MRCDLVESSDANPFTRLQRELAELTGPQRAELEWRSMMRLMQVAQTFVTAPGLVDILRRLLLARLFMDRQIDASAVRAVAAQPVRNIRATSYSGRQTGVSGDATQFLTYLISKDAHFGSATREAAAQRDLGVHVRDGDPVLNDIRQIKSGVREQWQNLPPLTFENMPQYIVAGEGNQPLYTRGSVHPFWADWYRQVIDGRPPNDPLLRDVALIDDAIWQAGGDALDGAIDGVLQAHALAATANGEAVELNPETGKLRLVPASDLPDDMAAYARRKILKAVNEFEQPLPQAYSALAPDLKMLRRAVEDAGNLPVELYDVCASALARLARRAQQQECPAVESDAQLEDYRKRLREVGFDILGSDAEARRVLEMRRAIEGNDALIEGRDDVLELVEKLEPALEGHLANALPEDAAIATNAQSAPSERAIASFRLSSRLLRIILFAKDVGAGVVITYKVIEHVSGFVQSIQFLATDPTVRPVLKAILDWINLA